MDMSIIEEPVIVDHEEPLSKAFGMLQRRKDDYFFVTRNKAYAGVVDSRTLRDAVNDPAQTKAKSVMMTNAPTLRLQDSDEEVVRKLISTRSKAIAVLDKTDKIVGGVTRWKALELLKKAPSLHGKKVSDVMSPNPIIIGDSATISQAKKVMKERGVFRLIVTNVAGEACGLVSVFDISTKVQSSAKESRRQYYYFDTPKMRLDSEPIKMIMTEPIEHVQPNTSVMEALQVFQKKGFSSLAVLEGKKPKGILTLRDLFNACMIQEKANVKVIGLEGEETVFKASLETLATTYLEKIARRTRLQPDDELIVHIKTKNTGGRRREFEVKSRVTVKGKVYASSPTDRPDHFENWDLQAAVKESLGELVKMVAKD
ncbi:CBS domain-containing protein [Candidatus Micrarchaeota archaeon]|nr:CBS domain-containing protein [Candidatus Micrarchaeota archaeon]